MIIINGSDSAKFELNGVKYPRNFMCIKQASDSVAIHNAYDTKHQLLPSTHFNQIKVDGVIYTNQADLISALATILFAKNVIIENPDTIPSTALSLEDKTTIIDNDVALIGDSSDGLKIKKTTWLNAWTNYIKGKVDVVIVSFKANNFIDFTSSGQAQLDSKIPLYQKAIPLGVATLNISGKVPAEQLNFGITSGTVAEGNDTRIVQAFNKKVNAISVSGDSNKTITLTREDGTILTANFLDNNDYELPDDVLNTLSFNDNDDGVLIAVTSLGEIISVSIDGRYSLIGHTHSIGEIDGLSDILDELSSSYEPLINGTAGVITKYKAGGGLENSSLSETTTLIKSAKKLEAIQAVYVPNPESGFTGLFGGGAEGTGGLPNSTQAKWRTKFYSSLFDFSVFRNDSDQLTKAEISFNEVTKYKFSNNGDFVAKRTVSASNDGGEDSNVTLTAVENIPAIQASNYAGTASRDLILNRYGGNVGIGIAPTVKFEVGGNIKALAGFYSESLYSNGLQYGSAIEIVGSLNDVVLAGFYKGAGLTNAPNNGWFYVSVETHTTTAWVHQVATELGAGNAGGIMYTRNKIAGNWTDWEQLSTVTQLNLKENTFTKNTAFNKNFGTTTGTVAEGNDARINNGQTAYSWGNHNGLYVTLDSNQEIDSIKEFLQSPTVPFATANDEVVNLQQLNEVAAAAVQNMHVYNDTTINLTNSELNDLYPSAPFGFEVQCMDLPIKPAIYKKSLDDTWMMIYAEYPI